MKETSREPYYTNSTQLPVGYTDDLFEAVKLQDPLQTKYTGGCVKAGTKILTNRGVMPIEEIVENFRLSNGLKTVGYDKETGNSRWCLIENAVEVSVDPSSRLFISMEGGIEITTSEWHPFFVLQKNGEVIEKRADELQENEYILQNKDNLLPSESSLSTELAYLLGFFIGDGCMSKTEDNRSGNHLKRITVRFFKDNERVLQEISRILKINFGAEVTPLHTDKRSPGLFILSIRKQLVADFLISYGFSPGVKTYNVDIPERLLAHLSQENIWGFLSGLMDSDGHIDKRDGAFEYSTVSPSLSSSIGYLLTISGVKFGISLREKVRENEKTVFRIRIPSYEMTRILPNLSIQRGSAVVKRRISSRENRHLPIVRVKKISRAFDENKFYDLMVENTHNYLAGNDNGFVFIHNTVLHAFIGEKLSAENAKLIIKTIFSKFGLPYLSMTPTFSICPKCGYLQGEHWTCPTCSGPVETYSRVVGYIRPVQQWNKGKVSEYKDRKVFKIDKKRAE